MAGAGPALKSLRNGKPHIEQGPLDVTGAVLARAHRPLPSVCICGRVLVGGRGEQSASGLSPSTGGWKGAAYALLRQ